MLSTSGVGAARVLLRLISNLSNIGIALVLALLVRRDWARKHLGKVLRELAIEAAVADVGKEGEDSAEGAFMEIAQGLECNGLLIELAVLLPQSHDGLGHSAVLLLDVHELGLDERHVSSLQLARFECRRWSLVSLVVAIEDLLKIITIIIAIRICMAFFVLHSLLLQIVASGLVFVDEPEQIRMAA